MKKILPVCSLLFLSSCLPGPEKLIPKELVQSDEPVSTTVTTTTPALSKDTLSCEEAKFVVLLNLYRKKNNLGMVEVSEAGVEGARWHAQDMNDKNYFSHIEPDGRTFSERALAFGYSAWSENIAAGNTTAQMTFCQWKNSSGHNSNMLRADHKTIGIGEYSGNGTYKAYWVNTFGPDTNDKIQAPLTNASNCTMPLSLPSC